MTTALTLFDLTALNPAEATPCTGCPNYPATTRVHAVQNLLGIIPTWLAPTWYRDATRTAYSGPCCDQCAWNFASSWWVAWQVCPTGVCALWAHTLDAPLPGRDCRRHHREQTVVWRTPLGVAR